ncbi:MAG: hypothetical protein ABUT39_04435 [Acidobacteriota bacterium]
MTELQLGQVLFGSPSGEGGFEVLGCTDDVTPAERDQISESSNIGGNIQREVAPEEIFLFYKLKEKTGRWAFARIGFRDEPGPRGNDYRVLTLILDRRTLESLRWNPFLLEPVIRGQDLFRKPGSLPFLDLAGFDPEAEACRPLIHGADPALPPAQLASVLRRLAAGRVEIGMSEKGIGRALCRSVMAVLPPEDRRGVSFCTRFAYTRMLSFDLTLFHRRDEGQVAPYLDRASGAGATWRGVWGSLPMEKDAFFRWTELLERGLEPIGGLSLLRRHQETVVLANTLLNWSDTVKASGDPESLEVRPERWTQLRDLVFDPFNRALPGARRLRADLLARELRQRIAAVLTGGSRELRGLQEIQDWLESALAEEALVDVLFDDLLARARRETGEVARLACMLLATRPGKAARIERLQGEPGKALFAGASGFASWLLSVPASCQRVGLDLMAGWFRQWRRASPGACLRFAMQTAEALGTRAGEVGQSQGLILMLAALEQAAPERTEEAEARAQWFLEILRSVGTAAGNAFPTLLAARFAAQEELIGRLTDEELARLAPPLVQRFPGATAKGLGWKSLEVDQGLLALLNVCEQQLFETSPEILAAHDFWELLSRVALRTAELCSPLDESLSLDSLGWILWRAAQLGGKRPPLPEIDQRLQEALLLVLEHCPRGVMHLAVRAVLAHLLSGRIPARSLRCRRPLAVRHQAYVDTHARTNGNARVVSLLVLAHLDRIRYFAERET